MRNRSTTTVLAASMVVATLAACGGEGESSATDSADGELTPVTIGIMSVANMAPLYLGIEHGFFEDEGLDVELVVAQGGAAIVPSVISGDFAFGYGNVVSLMQARDRDLDVQIVAGSTQSAQDEASIANGLLVAPDSEITDLEDIAGHSVAVTTLNNAGELTTRATLEAAGVDVSTVEFLEMGFPEMNEAVLAGHVDVAWQAEPFVTMGESEGMVNIADPYLGTLPRLDAAVYFSSEAFVDSDPDTVAAFQRALGTSIDYALEHEDESRAIVLTFTEIPESVANEMVLAQYSPVVNMASIELQADLALEYGMIENPVDVDALLADGSRAEGE